MLTSIVGIPSGLPFIRVLAGGYWFFWQINLVGKDRRNVYRTLLRVRVTSLEEVPQFIVFSEADGFLGDSWTVQCKIIQQTLLGGQPQDEDPVPVVPEDGQQLPLEFFGLGQPKSRLEGVNRAKLKFSKIITTTSRVSVRNIIESAREGAKQLASE
jgi:hypothetical protein